jgi:hypothetical protein
MLDQYHFFRKHSKERRPRWFILLLRTSFVVAFATGSVALGVAVHIMTKSLLPESNGARMKACGSVAMGDDAH